LQAEIDTEEDEVPINPLVDSLFDEIEMLRKRLHESEERAARLEIEIREEITKDLMAQMKTMEDTYNQRLHSEVWHLKRTSTL
jgi:kinesin family protein 20